MVPSVVSATSGLTPPTVLSRHPLYLLPACHCSLTLYTPSPSPRPIREPPRPRTMRQRTTRLMTLFSEAKQTNHSAIRPAEPSTTHATPYILSPCMHSPRLHLLNSLTLYTPSPSAWPIRVRTRSFDRPPSYGLRCPPSRTRCWLRGVRRPSDLTHIAHIRSNRI